MAGKRRGKDKPTRAVRRAGYWAREIAAAVTAEDQFAATARWYRSTTSKLPADLAAASLNSASRYLADEADANERSAK
jgi:hypothetical protein